MATVNEIAREVFEAFRPPAKLTLSEWADEFAVLSAESSAEAGRWKTIPYQRGIMDAITDARIENVTVQKSARVGYTKILNHAIAYHIHQDPCSMMLVQPTVEDAEGYSKEEIAPMLRDTPCLHNLVVDAKAKDGTNTILTKLFPGGTLGLVGANSPRGFRRVSRRIVLLDEVDGYPVGGAGTEGDQIKLATKRTEYFWNRKIIAGSTPGVKDTSRIEKRFLTSDQRRFFVPCPHCNHAQYLKWKNLKWDEGKPETAYFVCEKGGCIIEHSSKRWMIEEADKRQLADENSPFGWKATAPGDGKHAGFHIWAAYSYSPNASWGILAAEFLEVKGDALSLKTFVNCTIGETWEDEYAAKLGAGDLQARAEPYEANLVPEFALIVTAAVDVQDDRFEIHTKAWAPGEESWTLDYKRIYGDPSKPEIWKQLDEIIMQKLPHASGGTIPIHAVGIDTGGHHTHTCYQYIRTRKHLGVIALKGQSQRGKPAIGKPTKVDVNYKGQVLKNSLDLYPVGTDTIKSLIFGRLKHNEVGPGYEHFHMGLDGEFYKQLTSEKQQIKYVRGFQIREWVKPANVRNEVLDCFVYNYATFQHLFQIYNPASIWAQFQKKLALHNAPKDQNKKEQDPNLQNNAVPTTIRHRKPRGWMNS